MEDECTPLKYSLDGDPTKGTIKEDMSNTTRETWKSDFTTGMALPPSQEE